MKSYEVTLLTGIKVEVKADWVNINNSGMLMFAVASEQETTFPVAVFRDWVYYTEV